MEKRSNSPANVSFPRAKSGAEGRPAGLYVGTASRHPGRDRSGASSSGIEPLAPVPGHSPITVPGAAHIHI